VAVSVGQRLRQARETRRLTLDAVARETRVPRQSLQALEDEAFGSLPAAVYVRGFLRIYARHVGLDVQEILEQYEEQTGALPTEPVAESGQVPQYLSQSERGTRSLSPIQGFVLLATAAALVVVLFSVSRRGANDPAPVPQDVPVAAEAPPPASVPEPQPDATTTPDAGPRPVRGGPAARPVP
jgi:cytoskeleton protein RodZ